MKFLLHLVISDRADVLVSVSEEQPGFYKMWCIVLGFPAQSAKDEGLWFEMNLFAAQVSDKKRSELQAAGTPHLPAKPAGLSFILGVVSTWLI